MTTAARNQLARIDLALVQLLQERARILEETPEATEEVGPRVDDLLRRTEGPFCGVTLAEILRLALKGSGGEK
ncbi:MAG: hypothetical protein OTJ44_03390 [Planctomycetota bacterium]|jgi:hypothetical protein|nr:hypothetical protein [Planctomycetota bacterium]